PDGTDHLWLQPVVTTGAGKPAWQRGFNFPISPPPDPKPIVLKPPQYRQGAIVPVQLTSTGRYKVAPLVGGEDLSLLMNIDTRLRETTQSLPPAGGAQLRLGVQKFAIGLSLN